MHLDKGDQTLITVRHEGVGGGVATHQRDRIAAQLHPIYYLLCTIYNLIPISLIPTIPNIALIHFVRFLKYAVEHDHIDVVELLLGICFFLVFSHKFNFLNLKLLIVLCC